MVFRVGVEVGWGWGMGEIIWERINLPGILYGMEVADVDDGVMEQLETIQVRLGRVILGISNRVSGEWGKGSG